MKVSELGELGLIELIASVVADSRVEPPLIGIGDDAAAWACDGSLHLATSDALVEGVHFSLTTSTWHELGWKALAVNASDIAAMGGAPRYALVALGLPPDTDVEGVSQLYQGMAELGRQLQVAIVGGDVTAAPLVVISVALFGTASEGGAILTRSAAAPGELIAVTGHLGASAAGLAVLRGGTAPDAETTAHLRGAHLTPRPRVAEGQALARNGVRAAIDISDGLVHDLGHICRASGVGARVWATRVPIDPAARTAFGGRALELALGGGEDYELLFTAPSTVMDRLAAAMPCPITVIGETTAGEGRVAVLDEEGNELALGSTGWEHFKGQR